MTARSGNSGRRSAARKTVGPALAGPVSILVLLPVLVLAVGGFITFTAWTQQRTLARDLAERDFAQGVEQVGEELAGMVADGDAVLEAIRHHLDRHGGEIGGEDFAWTLRDQYLGRPMLAYIAVGTEGGDFYGVYRPQGADEPLVTWRERAEPGAVHSHLRDFRFGDGELEPVREDPAYGYDPRVRPWYRQALQADGRITSDPYVMYDSGVVGVTLAEPYRAPDGRLVGVLEVDFDINTMSAVVERLGEHHDARILLHTARGEILAMPGMRQAVGQDQAGKGRLPAAEDVDDPATAAYFARGVRGRGAAADAERHELEVDGTTWLAAVHPIELPGGVRWSAVCLGSLDARLAAADAQALDGLLVVGVALAVAALLALLFARHIVHTHVRVARAERAAAAAEDVVRSIGSYHLYRVLGEGGMGEVWLAEHGLLARPVAVKLINARYFEDLDEAAREVIIGRFEREARTLARLRSPYTITLYDYGVSAEGDLFYVMELLDGMDLYALIDRFGPQPVGRVVAILIQAARSLAEAHGQGLVHRDIKPANIYLCRIAGELDVTKVLDFGMVRLVEERGGGNQRLTREGTIEGTPPYMAPEQIQDSEGVDGRADLYALALVAYYLLSGDEVFRRGKPVETLMAQLNVPAPSVGSVASQPVPEALADLLQACLSKDPADRPPSMAVFIDALLAIPLPPELRWTESQRRAWWDQVPPADHELGSSAALTVREMHRRPSQKEL